MGKCYIDSINDKIVFNGSSIAFNEFTKYKNGKILTLDGVEIIDSTLLSRLTVTGGKLALDGVLVNGLNLSSITSDILPTTTTTLNLGSTGLKFSNVWSSVINTSTLKIDTASITFDGTVLKLGTDTLATREWVNSSAIPVLKTINGQSITGTGDITIVGGSTFMDIQYAMMSGGVTVQAPNVFIPFATNIGDSSLDYVYKVDASTVWIKAGVLYKLESLVTDVSDDDTSFAEMLQFGLYSDVSGTNLIKTPSISIDYLSAYSTGARARGANTYIKSDVDCYLKLKSDATTLSDSVGFSLNVQTTITKYNTTPILTDANGSYTQGRQELPGYSTTETLTSERWIDGKPIYKKVIPLPAITYDGVWRDISLGNPINGYETIVSCKLRAKTGEIYPDLTTTDLTVRRNWVISSTLLSCAFGSGMSSYMNGSYIVYEYTKTTDTASSPVTTIGGSGTPKKYFARISNGTATSFVRGVTTQIPLSTFGKGDQELHNGTSGFIAPQDDVYTITGQFFSATSTQANVNEITIFCYVNGVEEGRAILNPGATGGNSKGCNITVNTRLNKNDIVSFGMYCWSPDTTTSLQVPVGSFVATIRN